MSEVAENTPSTDLSEPPSADTQAIATPTVGELLIAARERCDLSAADIARQLRLALRQVEALEANQFERLPGNTFVRGFIRNYAKVVQGDMDALLAAYEQTRPQIRPQDIVTVDERIEYTKRSIPTWVWFVLGLLVLVLSAPVLIYFALRDEGEVVQAPRATVPATPAVTAPHSTELSLPPPEVVPLTVPPAQTAEGTNAVPSTATPTAAPAPSTAPAVIAPPSAPSPVEPVAKPKPGEASLKLLFQDEKAWVEIRDKAGKVVFSQLNQPGSEQTVYGTPPFSLVVGNAAKVRITYNGKLVDLTPHTKVNVARFTLE